MLAYVFILFAIAFRFMPHPMAFTPVGAALLFFGARAPRRRLWIPLVLLAVSDVLLTTLVYKYPFSWDHFVTWAWYAAMLRAGHISKERGRIPNSRLRSGGLGLVLPDQQPRRLGCVGYVSPHLCRIDDLLWRRSSLFPSRGCRRPALHHGDVWRTGRIPRRDWIAR